MQPIRLGMLDMPPFIFPIDSISFGGILAPFVRESLYFIFNKANVTIVPVALLAELSDTCTDDGSCKGPTYALQQGHVDFTARPTQLNYLNHVGTNLTLVPTVWEAYCKLLYKRKVNIYSKGSTFFDFIFSFEPLFWYILSALFIMSFGLFCIYDKITSKSQTLINILWSPFGYIMSQNFALNQRIKHKCFFLANILALLIVSKLISASLRTGLTQYSEYLKLETFHDVIKFNFTPISLENSHCDYELQKSVDTVAQKIKMRTNVYPQKDQMPDELYLFLRNDKHVLIESDKIYHVIKKYGCIAYEEKEVAEPFGKSEAPVWTFSNGLLINKNSVKAANELIFNGALAATENGIYQSRTYTMLQSVVYLGSSASPSCMESNMDLNAMNAPISLNYLRVPFIILAIGIVASAVRNSNTLAENPKKVRRLFLITQHNKVILNDLHRYGSYVFSGLVFYCKHEICPEMEPIRQGIMDIPPFLFPIDSHSFGGILAPFLRESLYFIFNKANVTIIPVTQLAKLTDTCTDDGHCQGPSYTLQQGHVDFVWTTLLNDLNHVGTNLTLIPIVWEGYCNLLYKRKVYIYSKGSTFFDFIFSFEPLFWYILIALFILCFGLFCIHDKITSKSQTLINILWSQFGYIISQNFALNQQIKRKCFFLINILALLIVSKLISASLRTGLTQYSEYLKLETFDDIIKFNFTPMSPDHTPCAYELQKSVDLVAQKIKMRTNFYPKRDKSPDEMYHFMRNNSHVTIDREKAYHIIKSYGCIAFEEEEVAEPFGKSEAPVFTFSNGILINKNSAKVANKLISNGVLAALENGIYLSQTYSKLESGIHLGPSPSLACMETNFLNLNAMNAPISLNYLLVPFIILAIGIVTGALSLLFTSTDI
uniref:Uncharacterized protein n=1 Tax=Tetranychus urticae TaxID=32264 RepID=T1KM34_TETUR